MPTRHPAPPARAGHAAVIGGGLAGLCAARVLADHFDRVTLVDRDRFPAGAQRRPGTPQARHAHNLLVRGSRELERLFPGLGEDLAAAGAPTVDWIADCRTWLKDRWAPRVPSNLVTRPASRDLLEHTVRRHLQAHRPVAFVEGHEALTALHDAGRVHGLLLRPRGRTAAARVELRADLVVDASGRDSPLPAWLEDLGYGRTRETVVNARLGYASRWYQSPAGAPETRPLIIGGQPPHEKRGGILYPIERDQFIVTLGGNGGDFPPTDEAGFLAFADSLAHPLLGETIRRATPASAIFGYRRTENRVRHFEDLRRWPAGIVAVGDAVCSFNPVYGQGMTIGSLGATLLDRALRAQRRRPRADFERRFQRAIARQNELPWTLATADDYRWSESAMRPTLPTQAMQRWVDRVVAAMSDNPGVQRTLAEVLHMVRSPQALLGPGIVIPVARDTLRRRRARPAGTTS